MLAQKNNHDVRPCYFLISSKELSISCGHLLEAPITIYYFPKTYSLSKYLADFQSTNEYLSAINNGYSYIYTEKVKTALKEFRKYSRTQSVSCFIRMLCLIVEQAEHSGMRLWSFHAITCK